MMKICRLCLYKHSTEDMKNVYQYTLKQVKDSLVDVLFWVFSIEIDVSDQFSKDICADCLKLVEYVLDKREAFHKNQEILKNGKQNIVNYEDCNKINSNVTSAITNCPTESQNTDYNFKNNNLSPRVSISLANLQALCPVALNLERFENTQDYLRYKPLGDGRFKKRKYRHIELDKTLLDEICNTLDKQNVTKHNIKLDVEECTRYMLKTKGVNTDETGICDCFRKTNFLKDSCLPVINLDRLDEDQENEDNNFLNLIPYSGKSSKTEEEKEFDWTLLSFKKDASTSTDDDTSSKSIKHVGINVVPSCCTVGTITKTFRAAPKSKSKFVRVNVNTISNNFVPTVLLEPLDDTLVNDYKKIGDYTYIKSNNTSYESYGSNQNEGGNLKPVTEKQRMFMEYYYNFSSFAVRELITGQKIRETEADTRPICKISNVFNVLVCDFCSEYFSSRSSLKDHQRKAHKQFQESFVNIKQEPEEKEAQSQNKRNIYRYKKFRGRRKRHSQQYIEHLQPVGIKRKKVESNDKNKGSKKILSSCRESVEPLHITGDLDVNTLNNKTQNGIWSTRRKVPIINYNLNNIFKLSRFYRNSIAKAKRTKARKKLLKKVTNVDSQCNSIPDKSDNDGAYVWDRKGLGTYSAIYYQRQASSSSLLEGDSEALRKKSLCNLNETITRLANRLDNDDVEILSNVVSDSDYSILNPF